MRGGRYLGALIIASAAGMVALLAWLSHWLMGTPAPW